MAKFNCEETKILIVSDSRGADMENKIRRGLSIHGPNIPIQLDYIQKGGLTVESMISLLDQQIKPENGLYDYVYIFVGVNNLSYKHQTGKVTAVYDDIGHLIDHMFDRLYSARNYLFKFSLRPVICQLVGIFLDKYNKTDCDQIYGQSVINQAVPMLNHAINSLNTDIGCVSPWLGATVHAVIHKKYCHKHMRLGDGLHPTEETTELWSKCFVHAIFKNYSWTE